MDSTLRPRDIQARIRAGETPESVAAGGADDGREDHAVRRPGARRARARRRARPAVLGPPPRRRRRRRAPSATPSPPTCAPRNVDPDVVDVGRLAPRGRPLDADRRFASRPAHGPAQLHLRPARQLRGARQRRRPLAGRRGLPRPPAAPPTTCSRPGAPAARPSLDDEELPLGDDAIGMVPTEPIEAVPRRPSRPRSRDCRRGRRLRAGRRRDGDRRDADEPERTSRRAPTGARRPAAAPRCRAGTRSCSAAASSE